MMKERSIAVVLLKVVCILLSLICTLPTSQAATAITLAWNANTDGLTTSYVIYRVVGNVRTAIKTVAHPTVTATINREAPGTTAQYYVTAQTARGVQSGPSNSVTDSVPAQIPIVGLLYNLSQASEGQPIEFELADGGIARGTLRYKEFQAGDLIYVSGDLTEPEAGRFFCQKQTGLGKAGDYAGVVELPGSQRAYRIEPTGPNATARLVEMPLGNAVCLSMPRFDGPASEEIPLNPSDYPDDPIPAYQDGIVSLQSLPGAAAVLYIDYRGGYTPTWGGITYQKPNVSNAQIRDVWTRVAEDFMPFKINVTTDLQVYQSAPQTSRQRVICTPTTTAAPGAGGAAYLNSWNWSGDTPCWSFHTIGKPAAEVISHQAGHALSLLHDGRITPSEGHHGGQGSGVVGWAPIMGVGYHHPVTQWSQGDYANASNVENDLALITGNNNDVDYRDDDTGITLADARYLQLSPDGSIFAEGLIETTIDADAFRFSTTGGAVSLTADPAPGDWANLAIQATLHAAAGNLIAIDNPQDRLWASINITIPSGIYTFRITGVSRNNPLSDGFSSYGSLGYYSISGVVPNIGSQWTVSSHGEINGNGKPDLVWRNLATGSVMTWLMDGTNTVSTATLWPATNPGDWDWEPVATGDFNGDGKQDIVWRNSIRGRVIVWFMDGVNRTGTAVLWPATNPADSVWIPMVAGNFNADGKPDLVWRNSTSGRVIVWFMDGITRTGTAVLWTATNPGESDWVPKVVGDFNADGKPDLVWRNSASGRVIVWFMDGVARTGTAVLWPATNPGESDWVPLAAEDFNSDRKPDLVWQNLTSGRVIIWFMNRVTRTSTATIWAP